MSKIIEHITIENLQKAVVVAIAIIELNKVIKESSSDQS